jgi:hypothetical protein
MKSLTIPPKIEEIPLVVTHNGQHHADEILACAILKSVYTDIELVRNHEITDEILDDARVIVVDIGRVYDPGLNNFDHHQNIALPAASSLIAQHFVFPNHTVEINKMLADNLLNVVSDVDLGICKATAGSFNAIIRNMTVSNALAYATLAWEAVYESAIQAAKDKSDWNMFVKYSANNRIATLPSARVFHDWRNYVREQTQFLITPSIRDIGCYNLISVNSDLFPIDPAPYLMSNIKFIHNSKFIAVVDTVFNAERLAVSNLVEI